jgi:hypothetical protein
VKELSQDRRRRRPAIAKGTTQLARRLFTCAAEGPAAAQPCWLGRAGATRDDEIGTSKLGPVNKGCPSRAGRAAFRCRSGVSTAESSKAERSWARPDDSPSGRGTPSGWGYVMPLIAQEVLSARPTLPGRSASLSVSAPSSALAFPNALAFRQDASASTYPQGTLLSVGHVVIERRTRCRCGPHCRNHPCISGPALSSLLLPACGSRAAKQLERETSISYFVLREG